MVAIAAILAVNDGMQIAHWIFNFLFTAGLFYVGAKSRKIETLEANLLTSTAELVRKEIELKTAILSAEVARINRRLDHGDGTFDALGEGDHKLEIKLLSAIADIRSYIAVHCASKDDLKEVRECFNEMDARLRRKG